MANRGVTLVELILSCAIGLVVLSALAQLVAHELASEAAVARRFRRATRLDRVLERFDRDRGLPTWHFAPSPVDDELDQDGTSPPISLEPDSLAITVSSEVIRIGPWRCRDPKHPGDSGSIVLVSHEWRREADGFGWYRITQTLAGESAVTPERRQRLLHGLQCTIAAAFSESTWRRHEFIPIRGRRFVVTPIPADVLDASWLAPAATAYVPLAPHFVGSAVWGFDLAAIEQRPRTGWVVITRRVPPVALRIAIGEVERTVHFGAVR